MVCKQCKCQCFCHLSHRKKKWRSRRFCTSRPDFTPVELLRWCCRWSVPVKVHVSLSALLLSLKSSCIGFPKAAFVWLQADLVLWWLAPLNWHFYPKWRQCSCPAGKELDWADGSFVSQRILSSEIVLMLYNSLENAGLFEGKNEMRASLKVYLD